MVGGGGRFRGSGVSQGRVELWEINVFSFPFLSSKCNEELKQGASSVIQLSPRLDPGSDVSRPLLTPSDRLRVLIHAICT